MNITKLYQDFNIQYTPEGEGHHAHAGWVQTNCPWCDDPSDHLGYNLQDNYFNCFRCGWHKKEDTIAKLLDISEPEATVLIRQYGGVGQSPRHPSSTTIHKRERRVKPSYPSGTTALTLHHKAYLKKRGFNPDRLVHEWGLLGTGPVAPLSFQSTDGKQTTIDYKYRIIAPIYWHNKWASFQARDITDRQEPKYMFCPPELELIANSDILYGKELPGDKEFGICVEGITDAWRFGSVAFATFGTSVTPTQMRLISRVFKCVAVIFDNEPAAQIQAEKLVGELRFRGVKAHNYTVDSDPGSMSQEEADKFAKEVLK